jgi:hypothetical protein
LEAQRNAVKHFYEEAKWRRNKREIVRRVKLMNLEQAERSRAQ